MREIQYAEIVKNVRDIIVYSASNLPEDALNAMKEDNLYVVIIGPPTSKDYLQLLKQSN